MKRIKLVVVSFFIVLLYCYVISFVLNLALNKQYVVNEITNNINKEGLEGCKTVIGSDYIEAIYIICFLVLLVGLFFINYLIRHLPINRDYKKE